jgi:hypothetical protein
MLVLAPQLSSHLILPLAHMLLLLMSHLARLLLLGFQMMSLAADSNVLIMDVMLISNTLLQRSTVATRGVFTIDMGLIWLVATVDTLSQ